MTRPAGGRFVDGSTPARRSRAAAARRAVGRQKHAAAVVRGGRGAKRPTAARADESTATSYAYRSRKVRAAHREDRPVGADRGNDVQRRAAAIRTVPSEAPRRAPAEEEDCAFRRRTPLARRRRPRERPGRESEKAARRKVPSGRDLHEPRAERRRGSRGSPGRAGSRCSRRCRCRPAASPPATKIDGSSGRAEGRDPRRRAGVLVRPGRRIRRRREPTGIRPRARDGTRAPIRRGVPRSGSGFQSVSKRQTGAQRAAQDQRSFCTFQIWRSQASGPHGRRLAGAGRGARRRTRPSSTPCRRRAPSTERDGIVGEQISARLGRRGGDERVVHEVGEDRAERLRGDGGARAVAGAASPLRPVGLAAARAAADGQDESGERRRRR